MDQDLKKLRKLVRFMTTSGVLRFKTPEMEIDLSPLAVFRDEPNLPASPDSSPTTPDKPDYTADEVLMWSAPGYIPDETETA